MKYERLTNRGEPFYGFEKCKTCEYGKDGCDNWCDQITGCFCRLQELEDKIESGELCDREEVRKETAREILERIKNMKKNGYTYEAMIAHLSVEYGFELFGNFDKLEDEE